MKKEILKTLIDLIDENDIETIFRVLIRFVPEDTPLTDEIEAIIQVEEEITNNKLISHDDINWN